MNKLFSSIPADIADRQNLMREIPEDVTYFSVMEMKNAFFQVKIHCERSRYFFGIRVLGKYYRFHSLLQGWKNSPAMCQTTYEAPLGAELRTLARLLFDDILVFSRTVEEHWNHVRQVLRNLKQDGIQVAWSTMDICKTDFPYLGMRVSEDQNFSSPAILNKLFDLISVYCSKISSWRTVQGLHNQYHRFRP